MTVQCDNCGSSLAKVVDLPDCVRLECPVCGYVEWIGEENEYEADDPEPSHEDGEKTNEQ